MYSCGITTCIIRLISCIANQKMSYWSKILSLLVTLHLENGWGVFDSRFFSTSQAWFWEKCLFREPLYTQLSCIVALRRAAFAPVTHRQTFRKSLPVHIYTSTYQFKQTPQNSTDRALFLKSQPSIFNDKYLLFIKNFKLYEYSNQKFPQNL